MLWWNRSAFNKKACVIAVGMFFKMLPGIKRHNQRKHLKQKADNKVRVNKGVDVSGIFMMKNHWLSEE